MLTIIESNSKAWAVAATNGDFRIYCRDQPREWIEIPLSDDSEQVDEDGSLLLEALYEQRIGQRPEPEVAEDEEPEAEEDDEPEAEEDEEPEAEEDDEPEAEEELEEEEEKPRPRSRGRTKARKQ